LPELPAGREDRSIATVVDVPERSRFEIRVDGEFAGFAEYRRRPGLIAFIHKLIDPRFEGRGLASQLVGTALSQERSDGLSVLPFCPFVRSYIAGHTERLDLVPGGRSSEVRSPRPCLSPPRRTSAIRPTFLRERGNVKARTRPIELHRR
jgi:predicted GNAT family acetyltransferase